MLLTSQMDFVGVVQPLSCVWLCNPMDCSTSEFPVLHHLPELAQTHVRWVDDAIQPSCPLSSPFPPAFYFSQQWVVSHIRWLQHCSFSFSISPCNEYSGLISFRIVWFDLAAKGLSRVFSNTTVWKHQLFSTQPSLWSNSYIHTWLLEKP